jgi:hypothetical protein
MVQTTVSGSTVNIACTFTNFDGSSTVTGGGFELAGTIEFAGANIVTNSTYLIVDTSTAQIVNSSNGTNALAHLSGNAPDGRIWVRYGSVFTTPGDFNNQGSVLIDLDIGPSQFSTTGRYTQTGGSSLTDLIYGGILSSGGGVVDIEGGKLSVAVSGIIDGNVTNAADFGQASGGLGGNLTINGSYTQTAAGTLFAQFSTASPYNVTVSGAVSLAGTIDVVGTTSVSLGNQFHLLSFAPTASPGDFTAKVGYYLGPNKVITEQYSPSTNPTSLTLAITTASLRFTTQPTNTVAGKPIAGPTGVQVAVVDANGVPVYGDDTDQISLTSNMGTLNGGGTVTVTNGVATFSGLTITTAASGYQLTATNSTYGSVSSSTFAITPDVTAKLVFTAQPVGTGIGVTLSPVQVTEEDQYNNVETGDNSGTISLALSPNPSALNGTTSQTVHAGVATFSNLSVSQAGNGYVLTATAGSVSQPSAAFNIATIATTTAAANVSALSGTIATLVATVSPVGNPNPVNEGTVIFKVYSGSTQIGSTTAPVAVSNGRASASFPLPVNLGAGTYTIKAYYTPGPDYGASQSDPNANGVLTVTSLKSKPPGGPGSPFVVLGGPANGSLPQTPAAASTQLAAVADELWRLLGDATGDEALPLLTTNRRSPV